MMFPGLHIGLAAWIHQTSGESGFLTCPTISTAIEIVNPETISNGYDLARLAEFSHRVNVIPAKGQLLNGRRVLWEEHRNLLREMEFATEPWSEKERTDYATAFGVLYEKTDAGQPVPSAKRLLYQEMKAVYDDLVTSGAPLAEVDAALTDWIVRGYKQEVEEAIRKVAALSKRSSVQVASEEANSLMEPAGLALRYREGDYFAPVYFSPLSAISPDTWMEAELTFRDIDKLMRRNPFRKEWQDRAGSRQGTVRFRYAALNCLRPWFTPSLYAANDWRLPSEELASAGNGMEGILPAYIAKTYLVILENIDFTTRKKRSLRSRKTGAARIHQTRKGINSRPIVGTVSPQVSLHQTASSSLNGRVARRSLLLKPNFSRIHLGGKVRKINATMIASRLRIAQQAIRHQERETGSGEAEPSETSSATYLVGFGCTVMPHAPNPNPQYVW